MSDPSLKDLRLCPLAIGLTFAALLACTPVAGAASPATAEAPTQETLELPNGLRIVVHEDHRAPTAVVQVWYRVGSIDESDGTTGLAHVLEHMMFKGTARVPAGQFSKRIARVGGEDNAFTGMDHTAYFEQIHRDQLELSLRMEADRMANLNFRDSDFASEIKVVMEERRLRTEDQPKALLDEQISAVALLTNPYRRPIVGWMDDLEHLSADDARTWYRRWYAPNNAILVVAGDVEPATVFRLARALFGPIPQRPLPRRRPQNEPEQVGARRLIVKVPAKVPFLAIAWTAPALRDVDRDWEPYALELLAGILAGDDTSRFSRTLVRGSQIAVAADAGFDDLRRGPGEFSVDGTPAAGHSIAELEQGLLAEIARIQTDGITAEELQRVKAQVISERVFGRDSVFFQAMQIGTFDTLGLPWQGVERVPAHLQAVTAEQVREVARRYLIADHSTTAVLEPQGQTEPPQGQAALGQGGPHAQ